METIERKSFTLSKQINGNGTFYSFRNDGIDEISFEKISPQGNVKDLYVLTFEKFYAEFENPNLYALADFIKEFENTGSRIILPPGWDLHLSLGILNAQRKFVSLSDNVHLNFPGMGGNAPHKIDYSKIGDFNILVAYKKHKLEIVM
jgi:hypothetical protein